MQVALDSNVNVKRGLKVKSADVANSHIAADGLHLDDKCSKTLQPCH